MFQSFYLYRVSRLIVSSVKGELSIARGISTRPEEIELAIELTIAFASACIEPTSLTSLAYPSPDPAGHCE
jgi:hypothetical protein